MRDHCFEAAMAYKDLPFGPNGPTIAEFGKLKAMGVVYSHDQESSGWAMMVRGRAASEALYYKILASKKPMIQVRRLLPLKHSEKASMTR